MQYMTRKEAMAYLKVGGNRFDRLVRVGMPYVKIGKQRRFNADEIDDWIKAGGGDLSEPAGRSDAANGKSEA